MKEKKEDNNIFLKVYYFFESIIENHLDKIIKTCITIFVIYILWGIFIK